MLIYEAIFFDDETSKFIRSIEKQPLEIEYEDMHCTFKFRPAKDEIFNELVGKEFDIKIVGYASDGHNSGFSIELPEELNKYYINYDPDTNKLKTPHITVSLSEGAKPAKTKDLDFKKLDKTYTIKGKFGYYVKINNRLYISYKPYH